MITANDGCDRLMIRVIVWNDGVGEDLTGNVVLLDIIPGVGELGVEDAAAVIFGNDVVRWVDEVDVWLTDDGTHVGVDTYEGEFVGDWGWGANG